MIRYIKRIEKKNVQWGKIVLHKVLTTPFSTNEEIHLLKNEIETFNNLKLMKNPAWLILEENKQNKAHAFIVITIKNAKQAKKLIGKNLCIADCWLEAKKYTSFITQIQCKKCQKFGHFAKVCKNNMNIS